MLFQKPPNIGDISSRIKIRKDLKCHSFDWYIENVFPEKFVPFKNVQYYGKCVRKYFHLKMQMIYTISFHRIKSMKANLCFDDMQQPLGSTFNMGAYPCHSIGGLVAGPQLVALTHEGVLRTETSCANVKKRYFCPR
jgi:polypeptide N-acetylgalactosaminyltransferase